MTLFDIKVDEDLICSVCCNVFEDPVSTPCGHTFCRVCITETIRSNPKCPLDRVQVREINLSPNITVKNLLDKLMIKCTFQKDGCPHIMKWSDLETHVKCCQYNPANIDVTCTQGCGTKYKKIHEPSHNCVSALQKLLDQAFQENEQLISSHRCAADKVDVLVQEMTRRKLSHQDKIQSFEVKIRELQDSLDHLETENIGLKNEVSNLKELLAQARDKSSSMKAAKIEWIQGQIDTLLAFAYNEDSQNTDDAAGSLAAEDLEKLRCLCEELLSQRKVRK